MKTKSKTKPISNKTNKYYALDYAKRGLPVLPIDPVTHGVCSCAEGKNCSSPGKHPMTPRGVNDATISFKGVKKLLSGEVIPNVAIATGKASGIVVLDVDANRGGDKALKKAIKELGKLSRTVTVNTGKGQHYYFKAPEQPVSRDVKGCLIGKGGAEAGSHGP